MTKSQIRQQAFVAFCSGHKELYAFLQEQAKHGAKTKFHIGTDWQLAKRLKTQAESLGWGCRIQKRYRIPAAKNGWYNYKKYKGLNWQQNGCPNWTHTHIDIVFGIDKDSQ